MDTKLELVFQKEKIGLGKRKEATARIFITPGKGNLIINKVLLPLPVVRVLRPRIGTIASISEGSTDLFWGMGLAAEKGTRQGAKSQQ